MRPEVIVRMTGRQKSELYTHLFPADGKEGVAFALCGRRNGVHRHCLSVSRFLPIPHDECDRRDNGIRWPTTRLAPLLEEAARRGMAVVKIHSHPGGYERFSAQDDSSDAEFFAAAENWCESGLPHGSIIALPGGRMFGRTQEGGHGFLPLSMVSVAGDELEYWLNENCDGVPGFTSRHAQVLGDVTVSKLRSLRAAVVGCSGTGSPTVEQLYRLGIGEILLVDPDRVEVENLNRILNTRHSDAAQRRLKVDALGDAIRNAGLGTTVTPIAKDLCDPTVVQEVALCDVLFGCVDSVYGRHVLNKLAATYCIPYFDFGVGLNADGHGGISHISGAINYLQPDGSSLLSRGAYTLSHLQADALRRTDPAEHASRARAGYIDGADVARPAVISVNMIVSGLGVLEFLHRLHRMRDEPNSEFAMQRVCLSHELKEVREDGERCMVATRYLGQGDMLPLLGMPELSLRQERSA